MATGELDQVPLAFKLEVLVCVVFLLSLNFENFCEHLLLKLDMPCELLMVSDEVSYQILLLLLTVQSKQGKVVGLQQSL